MPSLVELDSINKAIGERLRQARIQAGFETIEDAATALEVSLYTYRSHETGTRGIKKDTLLRYAEFFRVRAGWLEHGVEDDGAKFAGVSESELRQIIEYVMEHPGASREKPEVIADLVIDLCRFVGKSGSSGLETVVDFQMHRLSQKARPSS